MRRGTLGLVLVAMLVLYGRPAIASPKLGAALLKPDTTACVTFAGDARRVGDRVFLFLFSPPRVVDGVIRARSSKACEQNPGLEGQGYVIALRHPITDTEEIGIGLYDPTAIVEYSNGEFVVRTEGAGAPLRFGRCASMEGLHLTAWRGNRCTWHEYWYVPYELESDCTAEEAAKWGPIKGR